MRRSIRTTKSLVLAVGGFALGLSACGGAQESAAHNASSEMARTGLPPRVHRPRPACNASAGQVRGVDANDDGVIDTRYVSRGGQLLCELIDVNFDGQSDVLRFFGSDGQTLTREEQDFDFDGKVDQVAWFENGKVAEKDLDTNFDAHFDTWITCDGPLVTGIERDRRHSGQTDAWEAYENGRLTEARYDENDDGRPDKWEMFRNGHLYQIRLDTNNDGEADRQDDIPVDDSSPMEPVLTCDGSTLAPAAAAPAAAPAASSGVAETATPAASEGAQ